MIEYSIHKFEEGIVNEDAVKATKKWIAVSDGAGGGGVFADLWSKYLVEHLPEKPIKNYKAFDGWLDGIWEPFYNEYEEKAKQEGGMFLNKFYDEGSFATIVAVWDDGHWISYGDSVAFCYNRSTGYLQHTFERLTDFNNPPYLVNCKDPSDMMGFKYGRFEVDEDSLIFAASDALAHYILMMYEVVHKDLFAEELKEAINAQTKNSNFIKSAMGIRKVEFEKDVINKLLNCRNSGNFKKHLNKLRKNGLIGHDDYSISFM
jgi:hypothetical protein